MKSMFSISSAKGFYSLLFLIGLAQSSVAENYSLWPRRPEVLEKARLSLGKAQPSEIRVLLTPLLQQGGVVGKEAKELLGRVAISSLLDPQNEELKKYVVKRNDTWIKLVRNSGCTQALLMHLNGLMSIPKLHPGDVFKTRPLETHLEINVPDQEINLYDGDLFIKSYPIVLKRDNGQKNLETKIKEERSSSRIYDESYASSDKTIVLAVGGYVIDAKENGTQSPGFYVTRRDCNEIAMLIKPGSKVMIIREKQSANENSHPASK